MAGEILTNCLMEETMMNEKTIEMTKAKKTAKEKIGEFGSKALDGAKTAVGKIWEKRHVIGYGLIGIFAVYAKGHWDGYKRRQEEADKDLDRRMETLSYLTGVEEDVPEVLEQAQELIDDYGVTAVRKAFEDERFYEEILEDHIGDE